MSMHDPDTWVKTLADGKTYVGPLEAFDDGEWSAIAYPDGSSLWMFAVPPKQRSALDLGRRHHRPAGPSDTARAAKAARSQRLYLPGDHGRARP